jgi:hypothetical protein
VSISPRFPLSSSFRRFSSANTDCTKGGEGVERERKASVNGFADFDAS